jgi:putative heme-binding domain-containing protein
VPAAAANAPDASLKHPDPAVRKAALATLPRNDASTAAVLGAGLLRDSDALVRRAALLALAELPATASAGQAIANFLADENNQKDTWLVAAATVAAARHDRYFLAAVLQAGEPNDAVRRVVAVVAGHYGRREPGGEFVALLQSLKGARPAAAGAVLSGLATGWPKGVAPRLDDQSQTVVAELLEQLPDQARFELARLVFQWGAGEKFQKVMAALKDRFLAELANNKLTDTARLDAARRLGQMTLDAETLAAPELGTVLVERWGQLTPQARQQAVGVLLRRPGWTKSLLDGIEEGKLGAADLSLDVSQRLLAHPAPSIAARAKKLLGSAGGLPSTDRQKVVAELLAYANETGNAAAGREIFKRECSKCHRRGDLGETIGPDLTGFAVHPKDKILSEILDPNRSVEGNYRQYTVAAADGRVLTGLLASETRTAIELVDSDAKRHVVQREDIEALTASQKSLMPEGFEKLARPELIDLLEFLASKGKYVPLPLQKSATIVSTRGMFYSEDAEVERIVLSEWGPRTVAGVPFQLIDPRGGTVPNAVLLYGPIGDICRRMPRSALVPCNSAAKAIHILGGISGWGFPALPKGSVSVIVRLHYAGGETEDHPLINGEHYADYIRRVDVAGSQFAFSARGQQVRYLVVQPKKSAVIENIELIKGPDRSAPLVLAITVETRG